MTSMNKHLKRKHEEFLQQNKLPTALRRIVIHNVPTNVHFSLLCNSIALHIGQALRWSLRFADQTAPASGRVAFLSYDDKLVGHLHLVPHRSHHNPNIWHAEHRGFLTLFESNSGDQNRLEYARIVSTLNDLAKNQPLLVTGLDGKVLQVENLFFRAEEAKETRGRAKNSRARTTRGKENVKRFESNNR